MSTAPRRRPVRRALGALGALAVGLVAVVALAAPASAKEFALRLLDVDATWQRDGSLSVHERITYDFDGSFTAGIRSFPPMARGRIEGFTASEGGTPLPVTAPADSISGEWEWSFVALDEERTFDLSYRVPGITAVGPDVGELYWKVVEPDDVPISRVRVVVHAPTADGLRAWGHGPPSGTVALAGDQATFSTGHVATGRMVEVRMVAASSAFDVAPAGGARLPGVLAEEARFAQARRDEQRRSDWSNRASPVVGALAALAFVAVWWRWGKEPRPPQDVGDYRREPLDDPPAIVMGTMRFGSIPPTAFSATVVDLAQRGYLTITEEREERRGPDKVDYRFHLQRSPEDLPSWERSLLLQLFAGGPDTTMAAFTTWGKEHPGAAQEFWKGWQQAVRTDLRSRRYIERNRPLPFLLAGLASVVAIGFAIVTFALGAVVERANVLALVPLVVGVVLLPLQITLRRRTPAGAREAAEAEALKRYLEDFSTLDEAPIGSIVLWERYLVAAVALGVSAELVRSLALRVPAVAAAGPGFAPWYVASAVGHGGGGQGGFGGLSSFVADFGRGTQAAFTPSSSGHGGGFSGGGGGGFGGGSFGAR